MSQRKDTGLNINPWPKLVDHYRIKDVAIGNNLNHEAQTNLEIVKPGI